LAGKRLSPLPELTSEQIRIIDQGAQLVPPETRAIYLQNVAALIEQSHGGDVRCCARRCGAVKYDLRTLTPRQLNACSTAPSRIRDYLFQHTRSKGSNCTRC
jgi:hypothetical protein